MREIEREKEEWNVLSKRILFCVLLTRHYHQGKMLMEFTLSERAKQGIKYFFVRNRKTCTQKEIFYGHGVCFKS